MMYNFLHDFWVNRDLLDLLRFNQDLCGVTEHDWDFVDLKSIHFIFYMQNQMQSHIKRINIYHEIYWLTLDNVIFLISSTLNLTDLHSFSFIVIKDAQFTTRLVKLTNISRYLIIRCSPKTSKLIFSCRCNFCPNKSKIFLLHIPF